MSATTTFYSYIVDLNEFAYSHLKYTCLQLYNSILGTSDLTKLEEITYLGIDKPKQIRFIKFRDDLQHRKHIAC